MSETTPTRGFSPTGYILFAVFILSQRGGEVDGDPGTVEVDAPTQLDVDPAGEE